jgi:sugar transferase (PEP-CTERM/EpsH1 system associated)
VKIVVITSRFPFPIEKGDKLRAYHHIRGLAKEHEVHLISISHQTVGNDDLQELKKYCKEVHLFQINAPKFFLNLLLAGIDGLPMQVGYFLDQGLKNKIQNLILRIEPEHIYAQLIRTSEYVRNLPFPKTLDYMDVFSEGMRQRMVTGNPMLKPFYKYESKQLAQYEKLIYRDFDHHCIISEQDRRRLKIDYTENIHVLPNGVDIEFFKQTTADKKYDVVFVGNMGYLPNIVAAEYLVNRVLPLCKQHGMQLKVLIAGARPDRRVRHLASKEVHVSGWMEDIRDAYNQSKIFVAPIFSGMGQQNKILEAMSMSMPCITSTMVNNAIGASDGKQIYLANQPKEFMEKIAHLILHQVEVEKTGLAARLFIIENYSWEKHLNALNHIIKRKSFLTSVGHRG